MRDKFSKYINEMLPFYFEIFTQYIFSIFKQIDYTFEDIFAY